VDLKFKKDYMRKSDNKFANNVQQETDIEERIVQVKRVAKKNKGGNRISFTVLMAVGDKKGKVGAALGKAPNVTAAIKKAITKARKGMIDVTLVEGGTIAHEVVSKMGATYIMLKPAPVGAGLIAGGAVRTMLELAGVQNISSKIIGSRNKALNVYNMLQIFADLEKSKTKEKVK